GDRLDSQLAAVWQVLNQPGFEPPQPNPIRVLRQSGNNPRAEPLLVTDVLHDGRKVWLKPFLVGLASRHNVLLDLETGALAGWTAGDTAWQRTKGKFWFWESAGAPIVDTGVPGPDLTLVQNGRDLVPHPLDQFLAEFDAWQTQGPNLAVRYR